MGSASLLWVAMAITAIALLYSTVGHGGASGYIAVLTLFSFSPETIKPTALVLNLGVAALGTFQFWRAGYFSWKLFWPFTVLSAPGAWLGGYLHLHTDLLRPILGVILLFSALRFAMKPNDPAEVKRPGLPLSLILGAGIGFIAGLTGTGGGIFLTPLLLFGKWAHIRQAAAISAPFIFVNSFMGLWGFVGGGQIIPPLTSVLALAALFGGALGAYSGSRIPVYLIRRVLSLVLVVAGLKMIYTH